MAEQCEQHPIIHGSRFMADGVCLKCEDIEEDVRRDGGSDGEDGDE